MNEKTTKSEAPQTFAEWLNDRRGHYVSEVFHEICLRVAEEINAAFGQVLCEHKRRADQVCAPCGRYFEERK